jgi:putative endonuclease
VRRQETGAWGEDTARRYLEAKGYGIRARNWRAPRGEVDLIAQDGDTIVFVEVKTRTGSRFGTAEEAVTSVKQRRLQRAAWAYLLAHDLLDAPWRIDVIAIDRSAGMATPRIEHYRDAVDADPEALP